MVHEKTDGQQNKESKERAEFPPRKAPVAGEDGGAYRIRTCDPHNAIVVLYQLS